MSDNVLLIGVVISVILLACIAPYFALWVQAFTSGAKVSFISIILMRLHNISPFVIVESLIVAGKAELHISADELQTHYLAGGNVKRVVQALVAAKKANIDMNFERCAAIDLAGRDVLDAVHTSAVPSIVNFPNLVGATGVAHTALRPAGTVIVNDERIDAVSSGDYIDRGTPILIVEIEGHRVVVEPLEQMESKPA